MNNGDPETEERILVFLESMAPEQTDFLNKLEEEALGDTVPIIRPQTRSLLRFFLELQRPLEILEVGTGTGFSAALMLTYAQEQTRITTIEKDPGRIREAKKNFARIEAENAVPGRSTGRITLLEGDAAQILPKLTKEYDLVFMDAAKGQYLSFLPEVVRLLRPGGLLLSDNILQDGMILESRFAVQRRDRTIHRRMRAYLRALSEDSRLQTILLQEGDGMAVSVKRMCQG